MMMEAEREEEVEIGVIQPQAKGHWQHQKLEEARKDSTQNVALVTS